MRVQRRSIVVRLENAMLCTLSGNTFVKLPYGDEEDLLGGLSTSISLRCGTMMSHGPSDPMCSRPRHFSFSSSAVISTVFSFLPVSIFRYRVWFLVSIFNSMLRCIAAHWYRAVFFTLAAYQGARILLCARSGHARGARRTAVRISRRCTTELPT